MFHREFQERVTPVQPEFRADVSPMVVHGSGVDAQLIGYLFTRLILGEHPQHSPFSRSQKLEIRRIAAQFRSA